MRKVIASLILCGLISFSFAQEATVEKTIFGIQAGLIGLCVYNESGLSDKVALRSEVWTAASLGIDNANTGKVYYILRPGITVEPRYYYNLNKRAASSRRTDSNSGNYLSFKSSYNSGRVLMSNLNLATLGSLTFIPSLGVRRSMGRHFNYEASLGIGTELTLTRQIGSVRNNLGPAYDLGFRIGYWF